MESITFWVCCNSISTSMGILSRAGTGKLTISCAVSAGTWLVRRSLTCCGEGKIVRGRENFLSHRPARPILHIQKRAVQIGPAVSLPGRRVGFQEVPGMTGYGKGSLALRNRAEGVFEGYIVCR